MSDFVPDTRIIAALRTRFLKDQDVPQLLRFLQTKLQLERKSRILVFAYLTKAFKIPLEAVLPIGGWEGFGDGQQSDEEVQDLLAPVIEAAESEWLADQE